MLGLGLGIWDLGFEDLKLAISSRAKCFSYLRFRESFFKGSALIS